MKSSLLLVTTLLLSSGCATIMNGTYQDIEVASLPSNAKVLVDGKGVGATPLTVKLKRGTDHLLRIELAGYQPAELTITKRSSGWVWAALFVPWGTIGLSIDFLNGAIYTLTVEQLYAELEKESTGIE
ncbi:MAG: PEGA domain-containing protein [Bacteroidota bacterium]